MLNKILTILHEGNGIDDWHHMSMFGMWWMGIIGLVYLIIIILISVWVYQDAEQTNNTPFLWALVVFLSGGLGFLLYIIIRQPSRVEKTAEKAGKPNYTTNRPSKESNIKGRVHKIYCTNCGTLLPSDSNFCSECGMKFNKNIV